VLCYGLTRRVAGCRSTVGEHFRGWRQVMIGPEYGGEGCTCMCQRVEMCIQVISSAATVLRPPSFHKCQLSREHRCTISLCSSHLYHPCPTIEHLHSLVCVHASILSGPIKACIHPLEYTPPLCSHILHTSWSDHNTTPLCSDRWFTLLLLALTWSKDNISTVFVDL
jgi:hypothetical protein